MPRNSVFIDVETDLLASFVASHPQVVRINAWGSAKPMSSAELTRRLAGLAP